MTNPCCFLFEKLRNQPSRRSPESIDALRNVIILSQIKSYNPNALISFIPLGDHLRWLSQTEQTPFLPPWKVSMKFQDRWYRKKTKKTLLPDFNWVLKKRTFQSFSAPGRN